MKTSGSVGTSAHSYSQHYMEMSDQLDATVAIPQGKSQYLYLFIA